jgi:phosphoglycolate phosphatase
MNYGAVVFDLDGTLLDTLPDIQAAANAVLSAHSFPVHDIQSFQTFIGDGVAMLFHRALPAEARSVEQIDRCCEEFMKTYRQNWNVHTKPYDGIPNLLDVVCKSLRLAVLSNKPHQFTVRCVDHYLSDWSFEVVFGQRPDVPPKPDPAGALEIATLLNRAPQEIVYLGDSAVDMQTANRTGMFAVGADWGYQSREQLESAGAATIISHPSELLDVLGIQSST